MASVQEKRGALASWLCKFADAENEALESFSDCAVLLCIAEDLHPEFEPGEDVDDEVDQAISCFSDLLGRKLEVDADAIREGDTEYFESLCSSALDAAMRSDSREEYVQGIMELPAAVQRNLMEIIQELEDDDDEEADEGDETEDEEDDGGAGASTAKDGEVHPTEGSEPPTPERRAADAATPSKLTESPAAALLSPKSARRKPTSRTGSPPAAVGSAALAAAADAEAAAHARRRREAAESTRHAQELDAAGKRIEALEARVADLTRAAEEATSLRDQLDVLRPAAAARAQAEAAVERLRQKLKAASGHREQIRQLEAKNEELLYQTLELERLSKQVGPLRAQLEEAREGRCASEVRASELDARLREATEQVVEYKQAVEALRGEQGEGFGAEAGAGLLDAGLGGGEEEEAAESGGGVLGEGVSEFNPEVRARIRQLEEENRDLKETRDAEAPERVRKLENQLDEQRRMRAAFEGKYQAASARGDGLERSLEASRKDLEAAREELRASRVDLERTDAELQQWKARHAQSQASCAELQAFLDKARAAHSETEARLAEVEKEAGEARELHAREAAQAYESREQERAAHDEAMQVAVAEAEGSLLAARQEAEKAIGAEREKSEYAMQEAAEALAAAQQEAQARLEAAQSELKAYQEAHSVSDAEAQERQQQVSQELETERGMRAELEEQLHKEAERVAELEYKLMQAREEGSQLQRDVASAQAELTQADARAQKAERRLMSMEGEARRSRQARHADGAAGSQLQQLVDSQVGVIKTLKRQVDDLQGRLARGESGGVVASVALGGGSAVSSDEAQSSAAEEGAGGARRLRRGMAASSGGGEASHTAAAGGDALLGDFETSATAGGGGAESAAGYEASLRDLQRKLEREQEEKQQAVLRLGESTQQCSSLAEELQRARDDAEDAASRVTSLELNKVRIVAMLEREAASGSLPQSLQHALKHIYRMDGAATAGVGAPSAGGGGAQAAQTQARSTRSKRAATYQHRDGDESGYGRARSSPEGRATTTGEAVGQPTSTRGTGAMGGKAAAGYIAVGVDTPGDDAGTVARRLRSVAGGASAAGGSSKPAGRMSLYSRGGSRRGLRTRTKSNRG